MGPLGGIMNESRGALFFNRELSWLEFNARVLSEAQRSDVPLLERLKFLAIVSSNFDEFFMVRVATIKRQVAAGDEVTCPSGLCPSAQLEAISKRAHELTTEMYRCLNDDIMPLLAQAGILFRNPTTYSDEQRSFLNEKFRREILPVLTPVRVSETSPFLHAGNTRLHAAFLLEPVRDDPSGLSSTKGEHLAVVQMPSSVERIIRLPEAEGTAEFALIEHVIVEQAHALFSGFRIREHLLFRIVRDADLGVDEERDEDFVEAMEQVLTSRRSGPPVRLSCTRSSRHLRQFLMRLLSVDEEDVYEKDEPLDLRPFMDIATLSGFDHLREPSWRSVDPFPDHEESALWDALEQGDRLLFHPYDSFYPVIRLLSDAAVDPDVLAIKMTLYRTSGSSPIAAALEKAALNGKQVTALVELKARFDEERNIEWAERLARAGVIVVYGLANLKVHAKAMLIVRRTSAGIRRYVHLSTGNYNEKTAKLYTDVGILSADEELAFEVGLFFNAITGYSAIPVLNRLLMAPHAMKPRLIELVNREATRASEGNPGKIRAKVNSVADPDIIRALYDAAKAGVRIQLNIRGICMLVPEVEGVRDRIQVISIVDRYLEHARIFEFANGGATEVYISSADWMGRNLDRRVELMIPVVSPPLRERLSHVLDITFSDNTNAHELLPDGSYRRRSPGDRPAVRSQQVFYEETVGRRTDWWSETQKMFTVRRTPPRRSTRPS